MNTNYNSEFFLAGEYIEPSGNSGGPTLRLAVLPSNLPANTDIKIPLPNTIEAFLTNSRLE